ncbi:hypothetical protein APUTEX25_003135, partial [Auxenochlorella protothecoides]
PKPQPQAPNPNPQPPTHPFDHSLRADPLLRQAGGLHLPLLAALLHQRPEGGRPPPHPHRGGPAVHPLRRRRRAGRRAGGPPVGRDGGLGRGVLLVRLAHHPRALALPPLRLRQLHGQHHVDDGGRLLRQRTLCPHHHRGVGRPGLVLD